MSAVTFASIPSPSTSVWHLGPLPLRAYALFIVLGIVVAAWIVQSQKPDKKKPDDEKFVVEEKLLDDGRIGKVTDAQGVVSIKPVLHERWSPVQSRLVLKPGDRLEVLATNRLNDPIDASPAAVGTQLFLRGEKYLYCVANSR